jgi:hypothetical protein
MGRLKVTKNPKKVIVTYQEFTTIKRVTGYNCPSCTLNIYGAGIKDHTVRFRCRCGQELIIDKFIQKDMV